MSERRKDRRRGPSDVRLRPPSSPANLLILTVAGVLAATAAAAALLGTGLEETTPHGQVLTSLQRVAEAQEAHYRQNGTFAQWIHNLNVETGDKVRVDMVRADAQGWEAVATHDIGLSCMQGGKVQGSSPQREQPLCFTNP